MTLSLGRYTLGTPVVLAPMAGVTNAPFRQLCQEAARAGLPTPEQAPAIHATDVPEASSSPRW